jgi:diguanylate cyclase (GGDEF)-like protein
MNEVTSRLLAACKPIRHLVEVVVILLGALLMWQHPLPLTTEMGWVLLMGVPVSALAILFPVTLPSMLISLELVFTFYFALAYDVATALWVNVLAELVVAVVEIKKSNKLNILLNPMMKVTCLMAGLTVWRWMAPWTMAATGQTVWTLIKLLTVGAVYFLFNHLILNFALFLRTSHFRMGSALNAVKWEGMIYLVILPLAYAGYLLQPVTGAYTALLLSLPAMIVAYFIRAYNDLQWSNRVNQTCIRLSTTQDVSTIYQKTFKMAQSMTDSPLALLIKKQSDGSYRGVDNKGRTHEHLHHPLLEQVTETREVVVINKPHPAGPVLPEWPSRSLVLMPLVGKKEVFGIIILGKTSAYGFKQAHLVQLRFLANQASIILDRNHVYEELARAAITNQLTGLYNYQYFYEQLDQQFLEVQASGEELCLTIFDIDHFKKYNDIYGHVVGDEVLRQVAAIAREVIETRGNVLLARYGGEEFVAIARMSLEEAVTLAEQVRQRLETYQFVYQEHTVKNITVSIGIASLKVHGAVSPNDLLEKADQALYWGAKEMGRNRVAVYSSEFDQKLFVDGLTGLYTVHYLRRKLRSICEQPGALPLHFLLVDLVGMRAINDEFGFEAGNQVMLDTAYVLKHTMRAEDLICRYMDDEFLIVVKGIQEEDLEAVGKRLCAAFARKEFSAIGRSVEVEVKVVTLREAAEESLVWERIDGVRTHHSAGMGQVVNE